MLVGTKVILEEIDPASIEQMRVWRNDPALRRFFREWKDISKDKQAKWYEERGNNTHPNHIYFQIMAIPKVADGIRAEFADIDKRVLIGCCGILNVDWRLRSGELSIFIRPDYHGKGCGKETLTLLMRYAFEEVNLHKFWGECYNSNSAINLYRGVGFKDDGMIRDSWYHDGKYGNSYVFSILENEWRELYGKEGEEK